jgi:hypothetical protein
MMMTFNEQEQDRILEVKNHIKAYIAACKVSPWAIDNTLDFDWDEWYLTGGAIASLLQREDPHDYDFYAKDTNSSDLFRFILTSEKNRKYIKDAKEYFQTLIAGKMVTPNSITMNNKASFITMMGGEPKIVREHFDYVHCLPYYDLREDKLYISRQMYDAIVNKRLIVNNKDNVKIWRTEKFIKRGYKHETDL